MEENQLENTIKGQFDLSTLSSMSLEEFAIHLKEMPYTEDRTGQGFVTVLTLPKSETCKKVQSKIPESETQRNDKKE